MPRQRALPRSGNVLAEGSRFQQMLAKPRQVWIPHTRATTYPPPYPYFVATHQDQHLIWFPSEQSAPSKNLRYPQLGLKPDLLAHPAMGSAAPSSITVSFAGKPRLKPARHSAVWVESLPVDRKTGDTGLARHGCRPSRIPRVSHNVGSAATRKVRGHLYLRHPSGRLSPISRRRTAHRIA